MRVVREAIQCAPKTLLLAAYACGLLVVGSLVHVDLFETIDALHNLLNNPYGTIFFGNRSIQFFISPGGTM